MARNVFISFRYSDGHEYKDELAGLFDASDDTVDFSEDEDRSQMSDATIRDFLYRKLRRSSVTIMLLTPQAIDYHKKTWINPQTYRYETVFDDWIYDEIRYSLEEREGNATNGLVAVYVPEAKPYLMTETTHYCEVCRQTSTINNIASRNNLVYKNMLNVKPAYKKHKCINVYDGDFDSYCSLVAYDEFKKNFADYIGKAYQKRNELYKYNLVKRLQP